MKQQNNPIQSIISEIDEVLNQSSTRNSPKVLQESLRKSQNILQQIVDYLDQDLKQISDKSSIDPLASENESSGIGEKNQSIEEVLAPISSYLQEDFAILRQQRQALQEEIRQLEKQKQDKYILVKQDTKQEQEPIIPEFSPDLLGSEVRKKTEDQLEENSHFEAPFFDDSNIDEREQKQLNLEKKRETNLTPQSSQINQLNDGNNQVVLPYPGYEFFERFDTELDTKKTETKVIEADNSNIQESSISEQVNLENDTYPQLEAPIFGENNQNKTDRITDETVDIISSPPTPKSQLEESENGGNLDDAEILQSLSDLFGNLEDLNETETNQLNSASEEDTYIHALATENLLPIQDVEAKQKRELLLDTNSLDNLRSDLQSLEEIDLDEFRDDDPEQTQLQLGEYKPVDLNENSNENFAHLQGLFAKIDDNLPEESTTSNQDNTYLSAENTENELSLENILDSFSYPEDPEIIETDSQEILSLETLLEESPKSEKKNY